MPDKTKIKGILKSDRQNVSSDNDPAPRPAHNMSFQTAVIFVLLTAGIFIVGFALQQKQTAEKTAFELEALRFDNTKTEQHMEDLRSYLHRLELKEIKVQHMNGSVTVSGKIHNTGRRGVMDVELSVYCLDETDIAVCSEKHISVSPYGDPLGYRWHRSFSIPIPNVPDTTKDVHVAISNVRFVEPEGAETNGRTD